jgi:hypothetical protein
MTRHGSRELQMLWERHGLAGGVEDPGHAASSQIDDRRSKVTNVDQLCRQVRRIRDQDRAVLGGWSREPQRPIAAPVEDVARATDESDSQDQRSVGPKPAHHVLLARDLGFTVGLHAFHDVAL